MENEPISSTALPWLSCFNMTDEKLLIKWREIYENMETVTDNARMSRMRLKDWRSNIPE